MIFRSHVLVCRGSNCALKNSQAVREKLTQEIEKAGLLQEVKVVETGCFGLCEQGPNMIIYPEGVHYAKVQPEDVPEIVSEHLLKGRVVARLLSEAPPKKAVQTLERPDYMQKQLRVVLKNCGLIDPDNIDEYIARDGYRALEKALQLTPGEVLSEVKASGLRGRGGAGFPTGLKWQFAARAEGMPKYIVCNADEGEPGTSKDRLILEGDPHAVIEGMALAAYAVGAEHGYIYIRGEYGLSISRLKKAISQARDYGLLGQSILGSGFNFDIEIFAGAGAYVCGEETALLESMEGKRGEPRLKPPYPTECGLFGKPTVINNVETLANVAPIILNGAAWFRGIGTERTPGTKVFTLCGDIRNGGLIEVPMGITLREIIFEIGGGIPGGRRFKVAQTGGTSGGLVPPALLDVRVDYDEMATAGTALGSGALLVMNDTHCIVDLARSFAQFFFHESCGKCTPCREGTRYIKDLLERIAVGNGKTSDLDILRLLGRVMQDTALCPLGQTAPFPIIATIKHFESEYMAHINEKICPTGRCPIGKEADADGGVSL